jgi:hypothetical protein
VNQKYDAITCFENIEHFSDPEKEFNQLLSSTDLFIFSTELMPKGQPPKPEEWWYYCPEHGQHIAFYSYRTLEYLARKYNFKMYSNGLNFHVFTRNPLKRPSFRIANVYRRLHIDSLLDLPSLTQHDYQLMKTNTFKSK